MWQHAYVTVTLKPDFKFDDADEASLLKELVLQVRKTIGPFAAPKRIVLVSDLPKVNLLRACISDFLVSLAY